MSVAVALNSARFGDMVSEARTELTEDEFADWLELVAIVVSRSVADEIERRWNA